MCTMIESKPPLPHRLLIVISASLLVSHTFSKIGFFVTGVTHALVGTFPVIALIGSIVGILAVFILPNVNSEKESWILFLAKGGLYFTLVCLAQVLGTYFVSNELIVPTVAIFSAGILLLPLYSLITSAVSIIYLSELPKRSRFIGKLIPSLLIQKLLISVFAIWITYSTASGILTPSDNYTTSMVNLLIPLLFVFGLETAREKLVSVLGEKTGGRYFSLLSVVYIASLGMIIILEMGTSNYNPVIHETTVEVTQIMTGSDYGTQSSIIWVFVLLTSLMTIIGTLVPLYLNFRREDVSWFKSIHFLKRSMSIAIFYLICASFLTGLQYGEDNVYLTPTYVTGHELAEERSIVIDTFGDSGIEEVLVCSEYELQNMIYSVESMFGFEITSDYDISFNHMEMTQITNSPIEIPIYGYCTNIMITNITRPETFDSGSQIVLGILGSSNDDSFVAILHNNGEFIDVGSYTGPSEEEVQISAIPLIGLIFGFPLISLFNWRKYRKK